MMRKKEESMCRRVNPAHAGAPWLPLETLTTLSQLTIERVDPLDASSAGTLSSPFFFFISIYCFSDLYQSVL